MKNSQCLKFSSGLNEFFSTVKKIANFYPTKLSEIKFSILRHFMLSHLCWTFYQFWHCPTFAFNKLTFGNFVVFLKRFWEHKNFIKIGRNKKMMYAPSIASLQIQLYQKLSKKFDHEFLSKNSTSRNDGIFVETKWFHYVLFILLGRTKSLVGHNWSAFFPNEKF